MLSKIIKASPVVFAIAARHCKKQQAQLFYRSVYTFATNPNENPKQKQPSEPFSTENTNTTNKANDNLSGFTEYMQEPEKEPTTNYVYTNREVYSIKTQNESFAARQRGDVVIMTLMLSAGAVSFIYIHPLTVIIPLWFFAGSAVSLWGARKMSKTLCKSMELLNTTYVKLKMLSGEELVCKIEEVQILGIKEWNSAKSKTGSGNSYIVLGYFKDIHTKVPKEVRFIVDTKVTRIENLDLFRAIVHKDKAELAKFELKEGQTFSKDPKKTKYQFDFSEEEITNLEQELKSDKKDPKN